MKNNTLPVKRRLVSKGVFKRLKAVTGNRKQRVAATAEMEDDDGGSKISRALTIVFLIHIVAIGLIFVHQKFLDGRVSDEPQKMKIEKKGTVLSIPSVAPRADLPRLTSAEKPYIVRAGDNYARIAAAEGVDEGDLRQINQLIDIGPGLILKIPPKRPVVAKAPEITPLPELKVADNNSVLVEAVPVDVSAAPRATPVHASRNNDRSAQKVAVPASTSSSSKTYIVQSGDSVWRVANHFKVNQDALMKANGIVDARKIKVGMSLVIPR